MILLLNLIQNQFSNQSECIIEDTEILSLESSHALGTDIQINKINNLSKVANVLDIVGNNRLYRTIIIYNY